MKPRSQHERVLRMLRQAGRKGVDQTQVGPPVASDGGKPILRLASRIAELRAAGHTVETRGRRNGGVIVYVLVAEAAPSPRPPGLDPALFRREVGSGVPRCALFDDSEDDG